jgi:hypothetical protein
MQKKEVYYTIVVTRKRKKREIYNWVFHSSIVVNTPCVLFHSLLYDICLFFGFLSVTIVRCTCLSDRTRARFFTERHSARERGESTFTLETASMKRHQP